MSKRVFLVVLDSVGAGALPDAQQYGDLGANTLGHIIEQKKPSLPNMENVYCIICIIFNISKHIN